MNQNFPSWLKNRASFGQKFQATKGLLDNAGLNTVCMGAHCPNIGECFSKGTATFMILGNHCSRNCSFCAVPHKRLEPVDPEEPHKIAEAVAKMDLNHVVITSVTRDDLSDGGAGQFAKVINLIRQRCPKVSIEVLIPDLQGVISSLALVVQSIPNVINHNLETIPRLYSPVRPEANYIRSLTVLKEVKKLNPKILTKSGIMVGLGESADEVYQLMADLRQVGCDIMTIGQYLQPSEHHIEVKEFVHPDQFQEYEWIGYELGFKYVYSGPLVRSSFNAGEAMSKICSR